MPARSSGRSVGASLDRGGDPPVDRRLAGGRELLVDRLAKERVGEAEPPDRLRGLDQDIGVDRLLDQVDQAIAWVLQDTLEHVKLELATRDRGHRERLAAVIAEAAQTAQQQVPDAVRHAARGRIPVGLRADVVQQLLDEERVALAAVRDTAHEPTRRLLPGATRDQLGDLGLAESRQRKPLHRPRAAQLRERFGERVLLADLDRPVGAEDHQRRALGRACEVAKQQQARLVGPVQVVQEQHQRAKMRGVGQQRGDRLEQAEALLLGAEAGRPVGGARVLELRQDRGELRAPRGDLHGQLGRGAAGDVVAQRLDERLVGNEGLLMAAARQHRRAPLVRRAGELPYQARLADPGLAREHHDAQAALAHRRPRRLQCRHRIGPTDERAAVLAREQRGQWDTHLGRGLPDHLASSDRLGDALQRDRPERAVGEPAARADQRAHQLRGEDLAWRAGVAEPLGDHHRRAEVIALVADRLPDVQADANRELELAACTGAVDGLLDRDRARERRQPRSRTPPSARRRGS